MPGLDGTGPRGMGPMTGGGRGLCNPYSPLNAGASYRPWGYGAWTPYGVPWTPRGPYGAWGAYAAQPYMGFGFPPRWGGRMGFGPGFGWGFGLGMTQPDPGAELAFLEGQADLLSQQLEAVKARIAELQEKVPDEP
jgi:hypothetical protein